MFRMKELHHIGCNSFVTCEKSKQSRASFFFFYFHRSLDQFSIKIKKEWANKLEKHLDLEQILSALVPLMLFKKVS